jgi:hypothetical protein
VQPETKQGLRRRHLREEPGRESMKKLARDSTWNHPEVLSAGSRRGTLQRMPRYRVQRDDAVPRFPRLIVEPS